ncbi:hypothetical protein F2Q65_08585 [Thiohalocapsa marina]|uniref:Uncharacterized protein n=2 Tax=Thiohalocapsa marina TaxID=424902 RepID=A0A5M8FRK5_9GAMM|nr:hypothetical protein [Thiohalocapsa marina]KAA6185525.1 hypothetical protein F2Q65_08585 [Thiohalocapsa marina]
MELADAIRQHIPLQIRLPDPRRPLVLDSRYVAEAFLVQTRHGPGLVWLDAFWCKWPDLEVCHIAYATPVAKDDEQRWVDQYPRYGPGCLAYQKPVIVERLDADSQAWIDYKVWQNWRAVHHADCDREAAWRHVETVLSGIDIQRRV